MLLLDHGGLFADVNTLLWANRITQLAADTAIPYKIAALNFLSAADHNTVP